MEIKEIKELSETGPEDNPSLLVGAQPKVKQIPITLMGYKLSRFVLWIISGFIIFLIVYQLCKLNEVNQTAQVTEKILSDSLAFNRNLELIKFLQTEAVQKREFVFKISQMVLLNLLLPILTAILGYIFASNGPSKDEN